MDSEFRNHVRFKDYCKFCKAHAKGKAYGDSDSSLSSSDYLDEALKDMWRQMDPERLCILPIKTVAIEMGKDYQYGLGTSDEDVEFTILTLKKIKMDANNDDMITFKEYSKAIKEL